MDEKEFNRIRDWDLKCTAPEEAMFGTALDRRRLLEYVDELRAEIRTLRELVARKEIKDFE